MPKKQKIIYHKTCPVCNVDFSTTDFRRIYCSKSCYKKAVLISKKAQRKKVKLTPRPCIVCGKLFTPEKSDANLICSEECKRERDRARHSVFHSTFTRQHVTQSKKLKELAQNAHNLRMQRQLEAKEKGLTYGQYVALLGGE